MPQREILVSFLVAVALLSTSASALPPAYHEYHFEGNAVDTGSPGGASGTVGALVQFGGTTGAPIPLGQAMVLDGVWTDATDEVRFAESQFMSFGTGDFSIVVWVRRDVIDTETHQVLDAVSNTNRGWQMFFTTDQTLRFSAYQNNVPQSYESTFTFTDNDWHQVVLTVDRDQADGLKFYVDGGLDSMHDATPMAGWTVEPNQDVKIGTFNTTPNRALGGAIGLLRFYDSALTEQDILPVSNITQATSHETIQDAIDLAIGGDVIEVRPGTYNEIIDMLGKAITVRSMDGAAVTTIDATGVTDPGDGLPVVRCDSRETAATVLDGFTLTGGTGDTTSYPTLSIGGGMAILYGSHPTVTRCRFIGNTAERGGGIYNWVSSPTVTGCTFTGNTAEMGAGMYINDGNPTVINCSFNGNNADFLGAAIYNLHAIATVTNCIMWGDSPSEMVNNGGSPTVSFCDIENGLSEGIIDGGGNIDADPLFADADLRLSAGSPCLDAGDDSAVTEPTDLDGNTRIFGCAVDMGAYEEQIFSDTDGDGVCDSLDPCPLDNPDDTDGDGVCDSDDLCTGDDASGDTDGDGVCDSDDLCPASAVVIGTFMGTVGSISDPDGLAPPGVEEDNTVTGWFRYNPATASLSEPQPGNAIHQFPDGDLSMSISIGSLTWFASNEHVGDVTILENYANNRDEFEVNMRTANAGKFPSMLEDGKLVFKLRDSSFPFDLVDSIDLPTDTADLNLAAATSKEGTIDSFRFSDGANWSISFTIDQFTLSTQADADGDGVGDDCDNCPGDVDVDGDGICDTADPCPLDNPDDTDGDGICDSDDLCTGDNASGDTDGDGVCNNLDPCPLDNPDDTDGDGFCDSDDLCPTSIVVTGTFTGTVGSISDPDGLAPPGVEEDNTVTGWFRYNPATASLSEPQPGYAIHQFPDGDLSMSISIGSLTWFASNEHVGNVNIQDNYASSDRLTVRTATESAITFPGFINHGSLYLNLWDSSAPFDLVDSIDLPTDTTDLNLAAATIKSGTISSYESLLFGESWDISFTIDQFTLSQQSDTDGDGVGDDCDNCPDTVPGTPVDGDGCPDPAIPADFDNDGDVDGDDVDAFEACASGPAIPIAGGCEDMDFDDDGDSDMSDFAIVQRCLSGENMPGDPSCAD